MSIPTTDLVLHLDASDADSLLLDVNDKVEQWDDLSGEENHATQATEGSRPLWVDNILNGKAVIRLDGDFMKSAVEATQPNTIFLVWNISVDNEVDMVVYDSNNSSNRQTMWHTHSNNNLYLYAGKQTVGFSKESPFDHIINTFLFDGTSSEVWEDGVSKLTDDAGVLGLAGLTLGARFNNINLLVGDFAEVLIYDKELTTSERQQVEQYLGEKWLDWDEAKSAEATINISGEASKENVNIQLGESGTVNVSAEGSAVNGIPVSGEATISIAAEGAATGGDTGVQAGASATINIVSESGQAKATDVGSSATINVISEAAASKGVDKDSESTISISAEADKAKGVSVGASATIDIVAEGAATAEEPPREASAESTISISAQAAGTKITGVSSEALIEIIAEALGEKSVNRDAQALIDIFSEGDKVKGTQLGSDSTILISAEAEASTDILIHVGAEAIIDILAEEAVLKSINKDSEAVINILAQGDKMDDYLSNFKGTLIKIIVST